MQISHPILANASKRQHQAFELRCQGHTWENIAKAVGYANRGGAYKAYRRFLKKMTTDPDTHALRREQLGRLEALLYAILTKAIEGDLLAMDRVIRIIQEISKLMGLYLPQEIKGKFEIEHKRDPFERLSIEELAALASLVEYSREDLEFLAGATNGLANTPDRDS